MSDVLALLSDYFDETLRDPAAVTELREWVRKDPSHAREVALAALLHQGLRELLAGRRELRDSGLEEDPFADAEFPDNTNEPSGELEAPPSLRTAQPDRAAPKVPSPERPARRRPWPIALPGGPWALAAAIVLVIALTLMLFPSKRTSPPFVIQVARQANAQWEGVSPPREARLPSGQPVKLAGGCVELALPSGARILIEGPAQFTIDSPTAMTLAAGKLTAIVHGGGFAVTTPGAVVTDLGTEFGVDVGTDGATEVQVFKGRVDVAARSPKPGATSERMVSEGQAMSVSAGTVTLKSDGAQPQRFVRSLSTELAALDVVDLVAGGDGTTGRRGTAIDYVTGRAGVLPAIADYPGDYIYHRVADLPAVDGCFIPNGSRGPVQVDSLGHTFAFPVTSNTSYNHIWVGGPIPTVPQFHPASTVLGGVDYAHSGHGLLFMSANKGLTLDLAAIRRLHPANSAARFRCTVGNTFVGTGRLEHPRADVYVIVDGVLRFEQRKFVNTQGPFHVDIPIGNADRFLTLAVTDGGDGIGGDSIVWGDCVLVLAGGSTQ